MVFLLKVNYIPKSWEWGTGLFLCAHIYKAQDQIQSHLSETLHGLPWGYPYEWSILLLSLVLLLLFPTCFYFIFKICILERSDLQSRFE